MLQPSLKQWDEDRKTLGVVYDHSRAKPVERKNKIKKSRQAAFKSALAERVKPFGQHQDTGTDPSDSLLGKELCGAQLKRDEASSQRHKETHHMIQFFIKTPINPQNLCLRLNHNTTVSELKKIIHSKLGIRPALQNLYTNNQGFKLCDALTLRDLGINPDTNIDLTLANGLLGGTPTLDETFLQTIASNLRTDWQQLAKQLRFRPAEICKFERLAESNPEVQAFQMLVWWLKEQNDDREAGEWLRSALVQIDRRDLAARIPGYEPTSPRAGNKRQPSEYQSIPDASGIDEKKLRVLAEKVGKDWKQLATSLDFKASEIEVFENDNREPAFRMIQAWSGKHTNKREAEDVLKKTLSKLDRNDLVEIISGYAHTSPGASNIDDAHTRQSSEHQSITDTSGINEKMLRALAKKIGGKWQQLGISLCIETAHIKTYESNYPTDLNEQVFQMLLDWLRKQTNRKEAESGLMEELVKLDLADIDQVVPGLMGLPFKAWSETLVSHYKETLKVNTHPTHKDRAVGMDQLYVSLELLQETKQPDQPIILQSGFTKEKHKTDDTIRPDIEGEHKVDKTQIEYKKIPLKSYENMLSFDKERILITAESGYGKSTLLKRIAYDWAVLQSDIDSTNSPLSKYKLVFLLEINKMGVNYNIMDEIFSQILPEYEFGKKNLENYIKQHPDKVLILLDGTDEISFETLQKANDDFSVNKVLSFKSLKNCKAIVTSRQSMALKLLTCNKDFARVNIVGFDDKNKKEYIRKYFINYDFQHNEHVLSEINKSETLRSFGEIPLFLWLMCSLLTRVGSRLPDRITELLHSAIIIFYEQKTSKDCTPSLPKKVTKEGFDELMAKLGQVALEGLMLKSHEKHSFAVSEFGSEDLVNLGCDVGLLTRVQSMHGLEQVERVHFYHMILTQFCCSVYLSDMANSNPEKFNEYMSKLFEGDVDRFEYLFRFCCGRNKEAAECVIELTRKHLSVYNTVTLVECERYVCLHRIMMLALFESKLKTLVLDEWVRFPYELKGEDLLAAHFFIRNLQEQSSLHHVSEITIKCQGQTELDLLKQIMSGTRCDLSLEVVGVNMNDKILKLENISRYLTSLTLSDCKLSCVSVPQLFKFFRSATKLKKVDLSRNNLHGLKSDQIPRISSLEVLTLGRCKLTRDDIGPLFSIMAATGSVRKLVLYENNLYGVRGNQITPVTSLKEMHLYACFFDVGGIGSVFSFVAAAGSVTTLVLRDNYFRGILGEQITPVASLKELHMYACSIKSDDIGPLFSLVAAAGSVTTLVLYGNNLHGIEGDQVTPVSSLKDLQINACCMQSDDIGPLFSIVAAAGSVTSLALQENNLNGIKSDQITHVTSLKELYLNKCRIQSDDIGPLFSIVAAAGSVTKLMLRDNDLHGIKGDQITPVSTLEELHLNACGLRSDDIGPLFSIMAASGSVTELFLVENDLRGIKGNQITTVASLKDLNLIKCRLQSDDIGPLFSIVGAAGSVTRLHLNENNLHGIKGDQITPVSSLKEMHLYACSMQSDDVGPLFSIVAAAGSVTKLVLKENDLHGIREYNIPPVTSLNEFQLKACGVQKDDIRPLFSILATIGSVTRLLLDENNLHGIKGDQITPVTSLKEMHLYECSIESDDIEPLFSMVAAAGSVTKLVIHKNNLHGIEGDQITPVTSLKELQLVTCGMQIGDIGPLFSIVAAAGSVTKLVLNENDLHGIRGDQIPSVSSLKELHLYSCGMQHDDIGPIFSIVAAAGSVTALALMDNNLHGVIGDQIPPVPSLKETHLRACSLNSDDIGPLFSIVAAAGNVKKLVLQENDLHGMSGENIPPVTSLNDLQLKACGVQKDDIGPLFSIMAAAGSVTELFLNKNDLHGIEENQTTPVSSLKKLFLRKCGVQRDDIGPLFSMVAAAGSVTTLVLIKNDLHGIKGDKITPVSSLKELFLNTCRVQSDDIGPLFSIVSAAGSVTRLVLTENDLHGIQGNLITCSTSLKELHLYTCGITSDDIVPLLSIVVNAGNVSQLFLYKNDLHGIVGKHMTPVSSLKELHLTECGIQSNDIGPLFSIVAAAGSVTRLAFRENNLHGVKGDQITPVSSLKELYITSCSMQSDDIGPVFSILAAAGSVKALVVRENDLHGIKGDRITPVSSLEVLYVPECGLQDDELNSLSSFLKMDLIGNCLFHKLSS